jgi:DNA-binding transcriptional LysR family regulator
MITLHKLRVFRAVYELGSLNKAAQALYLAQSVVSQHIQDLENAYGVPLFQRTPRGVTATEAGNVLYRCAAQVLALLTEAEQAIAQLDAASQRQLNVAATPGVSVYLLPEWLQAFQHSYPNITVNLQTALTSDILRAVRQHRYDLGFYEGGLDDPLHEDLRRVRIRTVSYHIVVSRAHPWRERAAVTLAELAAQPFINRPSTSRTRQWLDAVLGHASLRNTAELDSPGAIKYALLSGMGTAALPDYAVQREVERGELIQLTLSGYDLTRPLWMVWDQRQPTSLVQRAFMRTISDPNLDFDAVE